MKIHFNNCKFIFLILLPIVLLYNRSEREKYSQFVLNKSFINSLEIML